MAKKTTPPESIYTYRNGKKIWLNKQPDQFVVRKKPEELMAEGVEGSFEKVSSTSTRVTVSKKALDPTIEEMRKEAVTHHAYTQQSNNAEFLITDRIMVTFKQAPTNEDLTKFITKYALILRSKYSDKEYLFQLTDQTGMNPVKLVVQINESEGWLIESCEHDLNKRMKISNVNIPVDAKYNQQWHLHTRLGDPSFDPRSSANCEGAWNLLNHFGNSDVVIAVSDDGCKIDHSDFDSPNKFAHWGYMDGSSLVNRDAPGAIGSRMYQDGADHGTCCCGVIAAEVDASLTVGAAPGCRLLPVKWESDGPSLLISDSKMMTVLNFIADKADVLSNSWGSSPEFTFASNVINKITQLSQTGGRRGKGIVFLWAAGNENCPIQFSGNLDIPCDNGYDRTGWIGVATSKEFEHNLAAIPGVMHVAALASNAQRSHYSNYGQGISICAPSSNSHEYWRMAVTGLGIMTTSGRAPFIDSEFGGTSSATPLVAGIAGLVISANPALTALEVISVLQRTAGRDLNMMGYSRTPVAAYDANTSWDISPVMPYDNGNFANINHPDGAWSGWFGFGKVDASAAVAEALRLAAGSVVHDGLLSKTSNPSILIPDNDPDGITDLIIIEGAGTVSAIQVDLKITHTYIGDLEVKLISPRGTPVVLHSRKGAGADNINASYDLQNTPMLSIINGEPADGNWTLSVKDIAAADEGILNSWTLHVSTGISQSIALDDNVGSTIPDNDPVGVERTIQSTATGTLKLVEVNVDITHSYISDLIINLVSPAGTIVNLHNKTGGAADNIIKTYNLANTTALQTLVGQTVQGDWKLKVSDIVGQDEGKFNRWSLLIIKQ